VCGFIHFIFSWTRVATCTCDCLGPVPTTTRVPSPRSFVSCAHDRPYPAPANIRVPHSRPLASRTRDHSRPALATTRVPHLQPLVCPAPVTICHLDPQLSICDSSRPAPVTSCVPRLRRLVSGIHNRSCPTRTTARVPHARLLVSHTQPLVSRTQNHLCSAPTPTTCTCNCLYLYLTQQAWQVSDNFKLRNKLIPNIRAHPGHGKLDPFPPHISSGALWSITATLFAHANSVVFFF
jgi:hypothetical protein